MDSFQGSSEVINNINDVTKGEISRKPISKSLKKKPMKSYECSECDYQTDNSSNRSLDIQERIRARSRLNVICVKRSSVCKVFSNDIL